MRTQNVVYPADVYDVRSRAVAWDLINAGASQYPLYNSGTPPVWLAFVDGCYTGAGNEFADAFLLPYWTAYNTRQCNDQAELGWSIAKTSDQTKACAEAFWFDMRDGWDADSARRHIYAAYNGDNKPPDYMFGATGTCGSMACTRMRPVNSWLGTWSFEEEEMSDRKGILVVGALLCFVFIAALGQLRQSNLHRLNASQAVVRAGVLAANYLGINFRQNDARATIWKLPGRHDNWNVVNGDLQEIRVDALDGSLRGYTNNARRQDQFKGRGRTGRSIFLTEARAREHLTRLALQLGVPKGATISLFKWVRDGGVRDANSAGYIGAFFSVNGKRVALVNVDPQDGALVIFSRED